MILNKRLAFSAAGAVLFIVSEAACAVSLNIQVTDAAGLPLADTVVYAEALSAQSLQKPARSAEIEQKGRKFMPLVSVVQTGTDVSFPNNDTVRHHVYSFSPAKTFDIKLYSGVPGNPVLLDKAGTVVVGCNIHDQMVAYIHVVSTPFFAKTDAAGKARLTGLAAGNYKLKAWYYTAPATTSVPEQVIAITVADLSASFKINAKNGTLAN
ncbi:MAG: methylamine utilization protein [Herminiimonas sp.]|nr:methylamine utilization protein [Herminiimonas sp.]